jgi:hypothetical protein
VTRWSFDKPDQIGWASFARCAIVLAVAFAGATFSSCQFPHKPAPTDLNDVPQHGAREHLRSILGELTAMPGAPRGYVLRQLLRAPIYSSSVDIAALYWPQTCSDGMDTCAKWVILYRWDTLAKKYAPRDSIQTRSSISLATAELTGDGLDELLLYSQHSGMRGVSVLGVTAASGVLLTRYQRDSIVPRMIRFGSRTALVEYDSEYARIVAEHLVSVPKKWFTLQGEFYLESPADTNWSRYLDHVRDSVHLVRSLTGDEMKAEAKPDKGLQKAFVEANVAAALLDTSWYQATRALTVQNRDFGKKLSSEYYESLLRLSLTSRASHFVRVSGSWNPQLLEVLGDLDDAIAIADTTRGRNIARYLLANVQDANTLIRAATALTGHWQLPNESNELLRAAISRNPRSVSALRTRATVLTRLGYADSARALLVRSLQFDSTSSEAQRIRQELGD